MATRNPVLCDDSSSDDERPPPLPLPPPPSAPLDVPPLRLSALPEPILMDIMTRLALPDVIMCGACCRAMCDAAQAAHAAVRANAEQHPLPVALALGQFAKPALTRALVSPFANYTSPHGSVCQWRDPTWVFVYLGTVLISGPRLDIRTYAFLPRCAVVGRLVHDILTAAPTQLRGGDGSAGLTTASALSAVTTALLGSPKHEDTDFPHCLHGLRACLWPLRQQPREAAAGLEAVRRVCKAWPLAPLEGTKEGARARRRAVEWLNGADTVANVIMRGWPAHTAAVAIAVAHTPVMEPRAEPPAGRRDTDSEESSISDNSPSEDDDDSDSSDGEFFNDGEDGWLHANAGFNPGGAGRRRRARGQELRRAGSGSNLDPVAATLWNWKWTQAPVAVAGVVASSCNPSGYSRPEGWGAEFVGVLLNELVWPAVSIAVRYSFNALSVCLFFMTELQLGSYL